eukprot:jgi/Chlat1/3693/Chrsp247S00799
MAPSSGPGGKMKGSKLLNAMYEQLERLSEVTRCRRVLRKRPEARTEADVLHLMKQTDNLPLFAHMAPTVHKDMCYVLSMRSAEVPAEVNSREQPMCWFHVLAGSAEVYTVDTRLVGEDALAEIAAAANAEPGTPGGGMGTLGNRTMPRRRKEPKKDDAEAEEALHGFVAQRMRELKELFSSIDSDGSGAIDAGEMEKALRGLGIAIDGDEVAKLIADVDADGSGEIEFPEFCEIMEAKLAPPAPPVWTALPDGQGYRMLLKPGQSCGEAALETDEPMDAVVRTLEPSCLLALSRAEYVRVLKEGFDGALSRKEAFLRGIEVLNGWSDLRVLAFHLTPRTFFRHAVLAKQGDPLDALRIIESGECEVLHAGSSDIDNDNEDTETSGGNGNILSRGVGKLLDKFRPHAVTPKKKPGKTVAAVIVGPRDFFGEEGLLTESLNTSRHTVRAVSPIVCTQELAFADLLRIASDRDLRQLTKFARVRDDWHRQRVLQAATLARTGMLTGSANDKSDAAWERESSKSKHKQMRPGRMSLDELESSGSETHIRVMPHGAVLPPLHMIPQQRIAEEDQQDSSSSSVSWISALTSPTLTPSQQLFARQVRTSEDSRQLAALLSPRQQDRRRISVTDTTRSAMVQLSSLHNGDSCPRVRLVKGPLLNPVLPATAPRASIMDPALSPAVPAGDAASDGQLTNRRRSMCVFDLPLPAARDPEPSRRTSMAVPKPQLNRIGLIIPLEPSAPSATTSMTMPFAPDEALRPTDSLLDLHPTASMSDNNSVEAGVLVSPPDQPSLNPVRVSIFGTNRKVSTVFMNDKVITLPDSGTGSNHYEKSVLGRQRRVSQVSRVP